MRREQERPSRAFESRTPSFGENRHRVCGFRAMR
jgi:hypothetical protein